MNASPVAGITIPVTVKRVIDGDTIIVRSKLSGRAIRVRLRDIDAPPAGEPGGDAATEFVREYLDDNEHHGVLLHVAWPESNTESATALGDILKQTFSFERLVGRLYVGGYDLGEVLMQRGHARAT